MQNFNPWLFSFIMFIVACVVMALYAIFKPQPKKYPIEPPPQTTPAPVPKKELIGFNMQGKFRKIVDPFDVPVDNESVFTVVDRGSWHHTHDALDQTIKNIKTRITLSQQEKLSAPSMPIIEAGYGSLTLDAGKVVNPEDMIFRSRMGIRQHYDHLRYISTRSLLDTSLYYAGFNLSSMGLVKYDITTSQEEISFFIYLIGASSDAVLSTLTSLVFEHSNSVAVVDEFVYSDGSTEHTKGTGFLLRVKVPTGGYTEPAETPSTLVAPLTFLKKHHLEEIKALFEGQEDQLYIRAFFSKDVYHVMITGKTDVVVLSDRDWALQVAFKNTQRNIPQEDDIVINVLMDGVVTSDTIPTKEKKEDTQFVDMKVHWFHNLGDIQRS